MKKAWRSEKDLNVRMATDDRVYKFMKVSKFPPRQPKTRTLLYHCPSPYCPAAEVNALYVILLIRYVILLISTDITKKFLIYKKKKKKTSTH